MYPLFLVQKTSLWLFFSLHFSWQKEREISLFDIPQKLFLLFWGYILRPCSWCRPIVACRCRIWKVFKGAFILNCLIIKQALEKKYRQKKTYSWSSFANDHHLNEESHDDHGFRDYNDHHSKMMTIGCSDLSPMKQDLEKVQLQVFFYILRILERN